MRLQRPPARRRQHVNVDLVGVQLDQPPVAVGLGHQLANSGAPRAPAQGRELAALATAIQERVELGPARRRQLGGQQSLDLAMGLGAGGRGHARERVVGGRSTRRARRCSPASAISQRSRRVVLDRALTQPAPQRRSIGLGRTAPAQVREQQVDVIAARLRSAAVGEQLVLGCVDLAGDEGQRLLRHRCQILGYDPEEAHRTQRHRETEPVRRAAVSEHHGAGGVRQRKTRAPDPRPQSGPGTAPAAVAPPRSDAPRLRPSPGQLRR